MAADCTSPISWLRLELYHLGELAKAEREVLRAHLESCSSCSDGLRRIEGDESTVIDLPRAEADGSKKDADARGGRIEAASTKSRAGVVRLFPVLGLVATAAAVLLAVRASHLRVQPQLDTSEPRPKGSGVMLTLVRQDGLRLTEGAGSYRDGDELTALVTCPPGLDAEWDLVVYEGGHASFPLPPAALSCQNEAPFPGAIRLTGSEAQTVCVVWSETGGIDRGRMAHVDPSAFPQARCMTLTTAR